MWALSIGLWQEYQCCDGHHEWNEGVKEEGAGKGHGFHHEWVTLGHHIEGADGGKGWQATHQRGYLKSGLKYEK